MDWLAALQAIGDTASTSLQSTQWGIIGEVAVAMLLGGIIGMERELANKPAGFRTHMMIAGAAALLVGLGDSLLDTFLADPGQKSGIRSDPIRIVEAVITGVSFLGAGTIFRGDSGPKGLTTAASLLLSGALGICVALAEFLLAFGVTLLTLLTLRGLKFIERRLERSRRSRHRSDSSPPDLARLQQELETVRRQLAALQTESEQRAVVVKPKSPPSPL